MGTCSWQPGLELGTRGSVLNGREKRVLHQQARAVGAEAWEAGAGSQGCRWGPVGSTLGGRPWPGWLESACCRKGGPEAREGWQSRDQGRP